MKRRLGSFALVSACLALLIGLLAPHPVQAAPAGGEFAVSGGVKFLGRSGSTSGGFPCKQPNGTQSSCEAEFQFGSVISTLTGRDEAGIEFGLVLTTPVGIGGDPLSTAYAGPKSEFTYANDLAGAAPECTQSFGAGRVYFDTNNRLNEASGVYRNATNPSLIVGASGWVEFRWRAVGTVMAFVVNDLEVKVNVFGYGWRTVMTAPTTTAGANGAGIFAPTSPSAGPAVACATNADGTAPMDATVTWDFALSGS